MLMPGNPGVQQVVEGSHLDWALRHTGALAVEMFFAMSAFLLWRPFTLAAQSGRRHESVAGYLLRRVARIVPGYWLTLLLVALWLHPYRVLTFPDGLQFFLFGQNLTDATTLGGIPPAWSLAVEAQFYVLLAAVALWRRRSGPGIGFDLGFAWSLVVLAVCWRLGMMGPNDHAAIANKQLLFSLPAHADSFAVGIALAALSARCALRPEPWARVVRDRAGLVFMTAVVAFLGGVLALHIGSVFAMSRTQWLLRTWLLVAVSALLIAPFALAPDRQSVVHRLLAHRRLVRLGRWSFGAYLWHLPIWAGMTAAGVRLATPSAFVIWFAAGVTLSFALGALSWNLVERPVVAWAARRTSRRSEPVARAVLAAAPEPAL
jgi:peptidoglycan/LPS O-acetylase OafA/YrhL